ncbi:MAG: TetR/AcrR family transcriptional regulator [Acidobacteria bacterium]|nr:TetR/AcrR family transcriptional regulator [Acidobacteriota bacterium]
MSRVSRAQAKANHRAIEDAASKLFRERGLDAVSIADVMGEAGLTHGGFYGHFPSKDALAASACEAAFAMSAEKWRRRIDAAPSPTIARRRIAEGYLSSQNRDPAVATCPTATLATDVARVGHGHPIRPAYLEGVRQQIETLATLMDSGDARRDRAAACVRLATMMGGLLLARAAHGDPLADEIAGAVRAQLVQEGRPR